MLEVHDVTTVRRNREFWERAVREVERGAAVSAVARRLAVRPGTLSWWRWHLRNEPEVGTAARGRPRAAKTEFLPVVVARPTPTGRAGLVEIDAGSARVRVEVGVDVRYVVARASAALLMLTPAPNAKVYLAAEPADLRRGHDGLCALVRGALELDPYAGHFFVFIGKRRDRVKILFWDRGGFVVYYKRLSRGRFRLPRVAEGADRVVL